MGKTKAEADAHPEAGVLYRVNGGEPVPAEEMVWGSVFPWDTVERKGPGTPWMPTLPEPPVFLKQSPKHHPGPDGRYRLDGPVWPPRR